MKLYEIGSGTKLYYLWVKGYSTWGEKERDTIFLCWLLLRSQLSTQPTCSARSTQSRLASPSSESQSSSSEAGTQLTAFSQILAHASGAWRLPNTLVSIPIWDFYFDISEWHILSACAWTPALMLHLTNPCAKRKVLSLTKPKGKIMNHSQCHMLNRCNIGNLNMTNFAWAPYSFYITVAMKTSDCVPSGQRSVCCIAS